MRHSSIFSGLAALLAVAAACQAYEPPTRDGKAPPPPSCGTPSSASSDACEAPGFKFRIIWGDWFTATKVKGLGLPRDGGGQPCRTTMATPADLGHAACLPVTAGGTPVSATPAATKPACCPPTSAGCCCVIKTADGRTTCVPVDARKVVVLKEGSVHADGLVSIPAHPGKPTVEGSLARLEALKAKQAEIEAEVKKEQAVLKGLLDEIQKRVNKVGVGSPLPPAVYVPPLAPSSPAPLAPGPAPLPGPYGTPVPPTSPYILMPHYGPSAPPSPGR